MTNTTTTATRLEKPAYDLDGLRTLFPHAETFTYLNHSSVSPQSIPVREAQSSVIAALGEGYQFFDSGAADDLMDEAYSTMATLVNASPHQLAFTQNTSTGLNTIAHGLDLPPGSNIIVCDVEFPSNVYPWLNLARMRGDLEARIVPADKGGLTVSALDKHADAHTALVSVSGQQFLTGHRSDVRAIGAWCKAHGASFVVDGIQSLGVMPLDVAGDHVNYIATGGMKALMGPLGIGFIYICDDSISKHQPVHMGWRSVTDEREWDTIHWDLKRGARRYEMGTANFVGVAGLNAAVKLLLSLGIANIDAWTYSLADALIEDLQARGYHVITSADAHGNIVCFETDDIEADGERLKDADIIVTANTGRIRVATHAYNTYDEVMRVGACLGHR